MAVRLIGEGVGERQADRTVLRPDQEVDVGDLVALCRQSFAERTWVCSLAMEVLRLRWRLRGD